MTTGSGPAPAEGLALPRHAGRGPRVAMLVYNDAHNDARVLKEAAALRAAGAEVRVFAVARERAGFPAGADTVGPGVPVTRAPEFSLERALPILARLRDRARGAQGPQVAQAAPGAAGAHAPEDARHPSGQADPGDPRPVSPSPTPQAESRPAAARPDDAARPDAAARPRQAAADLAMRAYKTVSLSDYWWRTAREVVRWRPDVIHANDGNTLAPAMWARARTGARLVYDSHELWLHRNVRPDRPAARRVEAAIERRGVRQADAIITVSPSIVRWLAEHYALATPPALVRNVPEAGPAPDPSRGRLRALAGLRATDRVIAYGGRITTSRGLEETLAAMALLGEDVHLVMLGYGEPDYLLRLQRLAEERGVAHRLHRVGPVAPGEVADALSDADLSVVHVRPTCLSYRFALPNKLFESIRGGLPVVAADLPDIREIVTGLGVGELFDGEEPADLAATIDRVLADPEPYRRAARQAAPGLTWEHESLALIGAYRRALLGGRP